MFASEVFDFGEREHRFILLFDLIISYKRVISSAS
jgi:hypothetical protein